MLRVALGGRSAIRRFSSSVTLGSVTGSGGLNIPDIQGEVRMNDQIKPGLFASGVVAGWVEASPTLKKEYGRRLDIFQICDGEKEKSAAAVLNTEISMQGKISCVAVLQHGAVDTFIDYLQFRASEAQSVAMRYAKEVVSDEGVILTFHHEREEVQLDEDERIIAKFEQVTFSFLKPKISESTVKRVPTGPDMRGLFDGFTKFPDFHEWEISDSTGDSSRSMWVVEDGESGNVVAGISRIGKFDSEVYFASPFLTDFVSDLSDAMQSVETLVSHILASEHAKSGVLLFDSKDPFKSFLSEFGQSFKIDSAPLQIGAIPATGLDGVHQQLLVTSPFQVAPEMLNWKLFNRLN